ncbi:MAG: GntR family transcriptional regulator [Bacteroidota bacterium]
MIERKSLSTQIIDAIWQLILDGTIAPNDPLREVHLAKLLNTSRTPLREALQKLEWEGIVTSEPAKGFRLSDFSVEEVMEIYPLRSKLEPFALELSGIPSEAVLKELKYINTQMANAEDPKAMIILAENWHDLLIAGCANRKLLKMIKVLHRQSQRYEYPYMKSKKQMGSSIDQHEAIINFLQKGELTEATKCFAENIMVGVNPLIEWVQNQKS